MNMLIIPRKQAAFTNTGLNSTTESHHFTEKFPFALIPAGLRFSTGSNSVTLSETVRQRPKGDLMNNFRNVLIAIGITLLVGVAAGWFRYWLGFVVIFHGAACAGIIGWLFHRARSVPPDSFEESNAQAWRWSLPLLVLFWAGQIAGIGLAQPWFEPLDYLGGIISGNGVEMFLAMGNTRAYGGGMSGLMWMFCVLLDALIMWILLAVALRDDAPRKAGASEDAEDEESDAEEEKSADGEAGTNGDRS